MSDEPPDNVVAINDAVKNARPVRARKKPAADSGGGGFAVFPSPLDHLPSDAPVKALGKKGVIYYFLDSIGQLIELKAPEIGRNNILGLFGKDYYLKKNWPVWKYERGEWVAKDEWQHGKLSPILIGACTERGLWDPMDKVRGPGTWVEEDGELIMHCGNALYVGRVRLGTGLRGSLLYPQSAPLPEPILGAKPGVEGPAATLLDYVETWNWARGSLDAKLLVGHIGCMMLGAAADWRSQAWVTGGPKSGKSTLQLMIRWMFGPGAILKAENATPAGVSQSVGYSSLPVSLDELEAKANNQQVQEVIELMRIASSGGEKLRGGADGHATKYTLKNCFLASSVLIPPLKPQDKSRMAILSLRQFDKAQIAKAAEEAVEQDEDADENAILGKRERWLRIGCQLRGRLIEQWPRYRKTFRGMKRALVRQGHDARAADQFGAIGAAYDCMMYDGFDQARADAWGDMLPPTALAETTEQISEERACLAYLLSYLNDTFRGGAKESVSHWLHAARDEIIDDVGGKDGEPEAQRTLAKMGLKIWQDARNVAELRGKRFRNEKIERGDYLFWIAVSRTHSALAGVFHTTQWRGDAGTVGTWAQALDRLPYAVTKRVRIDKSPNWVTCLPWETVFPPEDLGDEANMS